MRTYTQIKQLLIQQNLASTCGCDIVSQHNFFLNLVDINKIQERVYKSSLLYNKKYTLYYILYDDIVDEFVLNISFIVHRDGQIICEEEITGVAKWTKTTNGYMLVGNDSYVITKNKMESMLPKIYKFMSLSITTTPTTSEQSMSCGSDNCFTEEYCCKPTDVNSICCSTSATPYCCTVEGIPTCFASHCTDS